MKDPNTYLACRARTARDRVEEMMSRFTQRLTLIERRVRRRILTQPRRFAHLDTAEKVESFIIGEQDTDPLVASLIAVHNREVQRMIAYGTARIVEQNDQIIELLSRLTSRG